MIDGNCVRTGGWDPRSGTYRFTYEFGMLDVETRTAFIQIAVTVSGEARIDVKFDENVYLTCGGENSIQTAIRVGPSEAARTAVAAMPISDSCTLIVMLRADRETRRPIWSVERYVVGRPNHVIYCEIDAKSGAVLRQGKHALAELFTGI